MSYVKQFAPDGLNFVTQGKTKDVHKALEWLNSVDVLSFVASMPNATARVVTLTGTEIARKGGHEEL